MKTPLQLTTCCLSRNDLLFLKAMLSLANKQLDPAWAITDDRQTGVMLVDVDEIEGRHFWENHKDSRLLVAFAAGRHLVPGDWLLEKPLTVAGLTDLLARLSRNERVVAEEATPSAPDAPLRPRFLPGSFATCLRTLIDRGDPVELRLSGLPPLYVYPPNRSYYLPPMQPKTVCAFQKLVCDTAAENRVVHPITTDALMQEVDSRGLQSHPVELLLWEAALAADLQSLGLDETTLLRLKYWPNLTRLFHRSDHVRLAAFMIAQTADLATIVARTGVEEKAVAAFCNACLALDLLETEARSEPDKKSRPGLAAGTAKLFGKILKALGRPF